MAAAIKGYKLTLIMPSNMSSERRASMRAYGATIISVAAGAMEEARDLAKAMQVHLSTLQSCTERRKQVQQYILEHAT